MKPPSAPEPPLPTETVYDTVTVGTHFQAPRDAKPARELILPETPGDVLLAGKEIQFQVYIDRTGKATATFVAASPGVTRFTIRGAREQIEQVRWIVALDKAGLPVGHRVRVVFHWP